MNGHEWTYKEINPFQKFQTLFRTCTKCLAKESSEPGSGEWFSHLVTRFSIDQVNDWINNRSITIRKKKRRLVKVNGFYV